MMLVCMGHEPHLAADLENDVLTNRYKIKVKVVDIPRDKSDLAFIYDSEASIGTENCKLSVDAFYPRNVLQKLSQQKDDVTEWCEMVEFIMTDWNYDGAVMEPAFIDIPTKNDFVKGKHEIPKGASNLKTKITDLLSESYEKVSIHDKECPRELRTQQLVLCPLICTNSWVLHLVLNTKSLTVSPLRLEKLWPRVLN